MIADLQLCTHQRPKPGRVLLPCRRAIFQLNVDFKDCLCLDFTFFSCFFRPPLSLFNTTSPPFFPFRRTCLPASSLSSSPLSRLLACAVFFQLLFPSPGFLSDQGVQQRPPTPPDPLLALAVLGNGFSPPSCGGPGTVRESRLSSRIFLFFLFFSQFARLRAFVFPLWLWSSRPTTEQVGVLATSFSDSLRFIVRPPLYEFSFNSAVPG